MPLILFIIDIYNIDIIYKLIKVRNPRSSWPRYFGSDNVEIPVPTRKSPWSGPDTKPRDSRERDKNLRDGPATKITRDNKSRHFGTRIPLSPGTVPLSLDSIWRIYLSRDSMPRDSRDRDIKLRESLGSKIPRDNKFRGTVPTWLGYHGFRTSQHDTNDLTEKFWIPQFFLF